MQRFCAVPVPVMHSRENISLSIKDVPLHCGFDSVWTMRGESEKQQIVLGAPFNYGYKYARRTDLGMEL
jgi:hypothetical protein